VLQEFGEDGTFKACWNWPTYLTSALAFLGSPQAWIKRHEVFVPASGLTIVKHVTFCAVTGIRAEKSLQAGSRAN